MNCCSRRGSTRPSESSGMRWLAARRRWSSTTSATSKAMVGTSAAQSVLWWAALLAAESVEAPAGLAVLLEVPLLLKAVLAQEAQVVEMVAAAALAHVVEHAQAPCGTDFTRTRKWPHRIRSAGPPLRQARQLLLSRHRIFDEGRLLRIWTAALASLALRVHLQGARASHEVLLARSAKARASSRSCSRSSRFRPRRSRW